MDLFGFVLVGVSIVLGLALTTILRGIVGIARTWHGRRLYWIHVVWIANSLLWLFRGWWLFWIFQDKPTWSFAEFLLVMVHVSTMFVWLSFIAPVDGKADYPNGKAFYYGIKDDFFRWGIVHMIAYMPFTMVLIARTDLATPIWTPLPLGLLWISLMFVARKTDREWFHAGWALLNALIFVSVALDPPDFFRLR